MHIHYTAIDMQRMLHNVCFQKGGTMAPRIKFTKEEIVAAAVDVVRKSGIDALTARELAAKLNVSPRPIFTHYDSMDELKRDVYEKAKEEYKTYIENGLKAPVPFLGVGQQYIRFARKERELYRLLFLTKPDGVIGGAGKALAYSQELVRESIMRIYHLDAFEADCYFRDLWLMAFSFATLIVTDECPYTDEEISAVFSEVSLSILKAYKEVDGLAKGKYDKDALFEKLVNM